MSGIVKLFALAMVLALALFIAVICGGYAPWYFAWLVGTTMIVLISVSGAVLLETQEVTGVETTRPAGGGASR
jgi:predicted outer membrane lipoprotein